VAEVTSAHHIGSGQNAAVRAKSWAELRPGDWAEDSLEILPGTVEACVAFSGDTNPVHTSDAFARSIGLDGAIAHGLIELGLLSKVIGTSLPGPGSVWFASDLTFSAPVRVGDRLTIRVTVGRVSVAARAVVLVVNGHVGPTTVLRGSVNVRAPASVDG
jgi:acyl dehydratase